MDSKMQAVVLVTILATSISIVLIADIISIFKDEFRRK